MPKGLERRQNTGQLHFVTFSCYQREPFLAHPQSKEILLQVIEQARQFHRFLVHAYVLMPEHIHLLITEPETCTLASSIRVIKGQSSKFLKGKREKFWQPRYYDFNVFTHRKRVEKIRYIHHNPVTRGLVAKPEEYSWSSFIHYATGEPGPVEIESHWTQNRRSTQHALLAAL